MCKEIISNKGSCDLSQLSSYLRRNSNTESRKPSNLDVSCRGNTQPTGKLYLLLALWE